MRGDRRVGQQTINNINGYHITIGDKSSKEDGGRGSCWGRGKQENHKLMSGEEK